jgi:hypothetical protein
VSRLGRPDMLLATCVLLVNISRGMTHGAARRASLTLSVDGCAAFGAGAVVGHDDLKSKSNEDLRLVEVKIRDV